MLSKNLRKLKMTSSNGNWPFVLGIRRSPVNYPHKSQWCGALMFSFICAWMNGWVNNREAGCLRRHRAHYDVTVMWADWKTSGKRHLISCFWIQSVSETAEKYIERYMKSLHRINIYITMLEICKTKSSSATYVCRGPLTNYLVGDIPWVTSRIASQPIRQIA